VNIATCLPVMLLSLVLAGCGSPRPVTQVGDPPPGYQHAMVDRAAWPVANSDETLLQNGEPIALEIGVVVFDEGLLNPDSRDARDKLRSVESRLGAVLLRDTLTASTLWGPVRVLPSASQFAELTITAEVRHSDGRDLWLSVRAIDATNRVWLDDDFRATASMGDYDRDNAEPFREVFVAIANSLRRAAIRLSSQELAELTQVATLRYPAELAPTLFGPYVASVEGRLVAQRLPSVSDPMLPRIERIRNQEALFIDTVDEQYVDLWDAVGPTYRLWQRSGLEQAQYFEDYTARASARELTADRGSFAAMQQVYSTYRSVRIQEQDLFDLATGFDNETAPTVLSTGDRVVRLSGTLDQQYKEWRRLLAQLVELEYGVP